jgi:microcystin-dependent protein
MANYTKATNFLAKDSLASGDPGKIIKGSEFDVEFNALQTAVNSKANSISPALTGTPTAPTASAATNTTQIATTEFVTTAITAGGAPSGLIALWSGSIATIPAGWLLCNGTSGTPDLRNRFVVGAGSTYAVAATGGSADAIVVSHTHSVTDSGHTHTVSVNNQNGQNGTVSGGGSLPAVGTQTLTTASSVTGISINTTGSSGTNANLPPYYALAYIMKA